MHGTIIHASVTFFQAIFSFAADRLIHISYLALLFPGMALISFFKKNADSLVAAVTGFTIILLFTRHSGIGIEPDSVVYLSVAENLHDHGKLIDFTGGRLVDFPAGYPVFLNCIMFLTGLKPLVFAPVLNALLFAVVIFLAGYAMERFMYSPGRYKWAVLSCIIISPCLLEAYSMLLSESLFLVFEMLFFIAICHYFQSHATKWLIAAAIVASLGAVTRYAGITIIASGGLLILLNYNISARRRFRDLAIYFAISPVLLIINLIRNYATSGTITGGRESSSVSLRENMHDAGSVFYDWLPFTNGHYKGAAILFVLLVAGLLFFCLKYFLRNHSLLRFIDVTTVFTLIYLLFIVITACISRFETLYSRFFSPVYIPLIWTVSSGLLLLFKNYALPGKKWMTIAMGIVVFVLFQYGQLYTNAETWDGVKDAGIPGYAEDQWRYSPTVQFIEKDSALFQKGYTVYSDASDAIYFFTGRVGKFLPHKEYKPGIAAFLHDRHCYVVWFNDGENTDLVDQAFITGIKKMKLLKQFGDGAVYEYNE